MSGNIVEAPGETWRNVETSLRQGLRGLPGGYSLARLLSDQRNVRNQRAPRQIPEHQILQWADSHFAQFGRWPSKDSGPLPDAQGETWAGINQALRHGQCGLIGRTSLARFLAERRGKRNHKSLPKLSHELILKWADLHFQRTGEWPNQNAGPVHDMPGENWRAISTALGQGVRGLTKGSTLTRLLKEHRNVKTKSGQPSLSVPQILAWADAHFERTNEWPLSKSGSIVEAPEEDWRRINDALTAGLRGLPKGASLGKLLAEHRNVRGRTLLAPPLAVEQILDWADRHHEKTGKWPKENSGPIEDAPGETWKAIHMALLKGSRGLQRGLTLVKLLKEHRGLKSKHGRPPLTIHQILAWADTYHERTSKWPNAKSKEPIPEAPDETWQSVSDALMSGRRGLPLGLSLAKLLATERGVRNKQALPQLTIQQILEWADAHHARTGKWPGQNSGALADAPGEDWRNLNAALGQGLRGLRRGSSLAAILQEFRGVRNIQNLPPLTTDQILVWIDAHIQRFGAWPRLNSGPIQDALGETWAGVNWALINAKRGLPSGLTLARLVDQHRDSRTIDRPN